MKSLFKSLSKPIYLAWGQSLAVAIGTIVVPLTATIPVQAQTVASCGTIYGSYNNSSNFFNGLRTYTPPSTLSNEITTLTTSPTNRLVATVGVDPLLDSNNRRRIYYMEFQNGVTPLRLFYYDGVSNVDTGITINLPSTTVGVTKSTGVTSTSNNGMARMGFAPDGTLYISDAQRTLYRFSPNRSGTSGTISSAITIIDNANNDSGNSFRAQIGKSYGGDIAFDSAGRMYIVAYDPDANNTNSTEFRLFQISNPQTSTPTATLLGKFATTDSTAGLAFQANDNKLYLQGTGGGSFSWDLGTNTVSTLTTTTPGSTDLGSCTYPNLEPTGAFTKTVSNITNPGATILTANDILEYTLTITNNGSLVAGNVTLIDAIPTGSTYVAGTTSLNGITLTDGTGSAMPYANTTIPRQVNSPNQASGVLLTGVANRATIVFRVRVNASNTRVCNQGTFNYDGGPSSGIVSDDSSTGAASDQTCTGSLLDFGDAPDTGAGTGTGNYQTTSSDNGPRHTIVSGIRLGANIDADSGTFQNATADADDTNGTPDDEDGVQIGGNSLQDQTLTQGASTTLNIATQGSGVLNAWIDWNQDGDFLDSGEQIATNTAPTNNAIALTVPVPAGASLGNTYARFRYSSQTGLGSNGVASDGEVEDYRVAIASQSTISNPLPCDGNFYQIRVTTGSQLFRINRNFNPYTQTQIGTITPQLTLNALGYNKLDGFMYAIGTGTNQLYRIGQNGAVFLGIVTGLPAADYNTATFDSAGNYYVKEGTSNNIIYRINVSTRTATTITLTQNIDLGDMAFHPTDGAIYGLRNTTLYKITLSGTTGGTVTTIGSTNISGSLSVGSVFFDASGTLYGYENNGTFYLISTTNGNATQVSTATASSVSDGASCPFTAPERVISAVKSVATVSRVNSTTFNVPYTIVVTNRGSDTAPNTQITENLNLTFSTGTPTLTIPSGPTVTNGSCTANTSFNGTTDTKLLTGSNTLAIGSGTCTIAFTVQVVYPNLASVPSTVQNNTVYGSSTSDGPNSGYTFVSGTPIPPPALLSSSQSTVGVTYPATTNVPNLLLVKRITAVNGVDVTGFQDGVNTSGNPNNVGNKAVEDNDPLWPSPNTTSLRGAINSSTIAPVVSFKPGDEVEYTIYFLNKGDSQASNVSICDFVPANQTYVGTGYNRSTFSVDTGGLAGSNYGVVIQSANGAAPVRATNATDGDRGQFYTSGFPTSCTGTNSGRGAVVVNLGNVPNATGSGTPANSYGFIRFKAKID